MIINIMMTLIVITIVSIMRPTLKTSRMSVYLSDTGIIEPI